MAAEWIAAQNSPDGCPATSEKTLCFYGFFGIC
jgi:hypothetical protein